MHATDRETDQAPSEIEGRENESWYRNIFENAFEGIFQTTPEGRFIAINPSFARRAGYASPQEMIEKVEHIREVFADRQQWKRLLRVLEKDGAIEGFETEVRQRDGTRRWVCAHVKTVRNGDGKIVRYEGMTEDISQRKEAERRLRESEERFRLTFDQSPIGAAMVLPDFTFLRVNDELCRILGYGREELLKLTFREVTHPEDLERDLRAREQMNKGEINGFRLEKRYIRKGGGIIWGKLTISPVKDAQDNLLYYLAMVEDITEQKRAHEALAKSEREYRRLIETAHEGISIVDSGYALTYVNQMFAETFGYSAADLVGRALSSLLFPQDIASYEEMRKRRGKGVREKFEGRFRHRDGSERWAIISATPVFSEEGRFEGSIAMLTDITERRQSEEKLRKSEERFRKLLNDNHSVMLLIDPDSGEILDANPAACSFYGYASEAIRRMKVWDLNTLSRPQVLSRLREAKAGQRKFFDFTHRLSNGELRNVDVYSGPISLNGRTVLFSIIHDITERKRAEEELRDSEERLSRAFINLPIPALLTDYESGRIIDLNQSCLSLTGFSRGEVTGKKLSELGFLLDADLRDALLDRLEREGSFSAQPIQCRLKEGPTLDLLWSAELIRYKKQRIVLSLVADVTQRNQFEREKKLLEAQLQQAQKMKALGTLAGGIAHDFNNILGSMIGYTEMTLRRELPEGSKGRHYLEQVLKAGIRAKDLVDQILAFSRRQSLEKRPLHLIPVLEDALKLMRSSLPSTIEIKKDLEAQNDDVLGEPVQFHQVLMNLCTNAAHAMNQKGGTLGIRLRNERLDERTAGLLSLKPGPYLRLSVSDTGQGIPPDVLPRIFEPFFSTKENNKGTGLGLAVVYGIAKDSGGTVTVESQPGQGARFDVYFPVITPPAQESSCPASTGPDLPGGSERILFVDDEPQLARLGEDMLGPLGYEVIPATDSSKALEIFRDDPGRIDLLITDYTMPVMTGADLAQKALALRPDLPVIVMTGYSEVLTREKAQAIGIREIVMKPFFIRDLARTVRSALDSGAGSGAGNGADEGAKGDKK